MSIQEQYLKDIADAIREKKETAEPIKASNFAEEIRNIKGGITINPVSNLVLSEFGVLTFDEPDVSDYEEYSPVLSYIITVNGTKLTSNANSSNVFNYLVEGDNTISVVAKATLYSNSDSKEEVIAYSIPVYTNIADFTLESVTVGSETGYKVTAYNGSETEINIPPTNTDGLPILACGNLAVSKINGSSIKQIDSFTSNTTITEINFPNTSENTTMAYYFNGCSQLESVIALDTSNVTSMNSMFRSCSFLQTIPPLDTSNVTNMSYMFRACSSLQTIPPLDTSNVTNMSYMLGSCSALKSILMYGMQVSFAISVSTQFEREDLVVILNNLATISSTQTLTMGETNLAKLTDEDKLIATNKGWTLA